MALPVQHISESGLIATYYKAASDGTDDAVTLAWDEETESTEMDYYDDFPNSGHAVLAVKNEASSGRTFTVLAQKDSFQHGTYGAADKKDISITVTAGAIALVGPFRPAAYNDNNESIQIIYDSIDSVKVAALNINNVKRAGG